MGREWEGTEDLAPAGLAGPGSREGGGAPVQTRRPKASMQGPGPLPLEPCTQPLRLCRAASAESAWAFVVTRAEEKDGCWFVSELLARTPTKGMPVSDPLGLGRRDRDVQGHGGCSAVFEFTHVRM